MSGPEEVVVGQQPRAFTTAWEVEMCRVTHVTAPQQFFFKKREMLYSSTYNTMLGAVPACVYVCMYVFIHTCTHTCTHLSHTHTLIHTYTNISVIYAPAQGEYMGKIKKSSANHYSSVIKRVYKKAKA
jgi:hypothetical protein